MKTKHLVTILIATFAAGWLASAADDTTNTPVEIAPPDAVAAPDAAAPPDAPPDAANAPDVAPDAANAPAPGEPAYAAPANARANARDRRAPRTAAIAEVEASALLDTNMPAGPTPTNGLVLNFHEAPLNAVLNYLSAKAGLIIMTDADLRGKVSVVSRQPIATNEIVDLLSEQLAKNHFAVSLSGRTLTIMDASGAKSSSQTPVVVERNGFANIPANDIIVTEILPVHTLQPAQLVRDLDQLIPQGATVTANDAGNAIIMTAAQKDVRRIAEIISALDSSAISDVEVFPLAYADSKSVASELKEIFQSADSDITRANTRNTIGAGGGRGGGFNPMAMMMGGGGGGGNSSTTQNAQTHTVFTSDDQLNAIVASAPPDYMATVSNVIVQLDQPSQDITQIRVFRLKHADPTEIANELASLFPSSTSSDQGNRTAGFRFNPFGGGGGGQAASTQSTRMKRQSTVLAVADARTESVVVTASQDMMEEITGMIEKLDEGTKGNQHVYAFSLDNADPNSVQLTMSTLFGGSTSKSSTTTTTALSARETANANSQSSTTSSSSSSFGSSSSGSGGTTGLR
jgi:general secretion pathway protein D